MNSEGHTPCQSAWESPRPDNRVVRQMLGKKSQAFDVQLTQNRLADCCSVHKPYPGQNRNYTIQYYTSTTHIVQHNPIQQSLSKSMQISSNKWHLFFSRSWSSSNLAAGNLWGSQLGPLLRCWKRRISQLHLSATLQAKKAKRVMTSKFRSSQVGCGDVTDWSVHKNDKKWQSHGQSRIFSRKIPETVM